jgi:hypothetical protein
MYMMCLGGGGGLRRQLLLLSTPFLISSLNTPCKLLD